MLSKKVISIGFGDIASRYSKLFIKAGNSVYAIARSEKPVPEGVTFYQCDLNAADAAQRIQQPYDAAIITLTPSSRDDEGYYRAYVESTKRLIHLWENSFKPELVIFASSTSVYGQSNGEWVDENSLTHPRQHTGRRLLQAENLLKLSTLNHCIVRFSGIYGPNRYALLKNVESGVLGGPNFTNRIHADDCAGILHFLCGQYWQGNLEHRMYLASDSNPVTGLEISTWLAEKMGLGKSHLTIPSLSQRIGNKRCSNHRLLSSGYRFLYPNFREGYQKELDMLKYR